MSHERYSGPSDDGDFEAIDVTMTATIRPGVVQKTMDSFRLNMMEPNVHRFRLLLNVDPVGEYGKLEGDVINVALQQFNQVLCRMPAAPSFPAALHWCFTQVRTPFFLNIEDDWELLRRVEVFDMLYFMVKYPDLAILRLPFSKAANERAKQWNKWFPWNGEFFECPEELKPGLGFCGHPSLIRTEFIKEVLRFLDPTGGCPEKQIKGRHPRMREILLRWRFGVFQKQGEEPYVKDIGRVWRSFHNYEKNGSYGFTTWKRKQ